MTPKKKERQQMLKPLLLSPPNKSPEAALLQWTWAESAKAEASFTAQGSSHINPLSIIHVLMAPSDLHLQPIPAAYLVEIVYCILTCVLCGLSCGLYPMGKWEILSLT